MTKDVGCSAWSRIKAAFPPICNGPITREYRIPVHGRVFSLLGTTISVSRPVSPDVVEWASTLSPGRVRRRSRRTVEDRNSKAGNVGSIDTAGKTLNPTGRGISGLAFVGRNRIVFTARIHALKDVALRLSICKYDRRKVELEFRVHSQVAGHDVFV